MKGITHVIVIEEFIDIMHKLRIPKQPKATKRSNAFQPIDHGYFKQHRYQAMQPDCVHLTPLQRISTAW
tara:strand:- start:237 stop:443 length:207 start_codon:yes stop_codon:yes gene_type:complete